MHRISTSRITVLPVETSSVHAFMLFLPDSPQFEEEVGGLCQLLLASPCCPHHPGSRGGIAKGPETGARKLYLRGF